MTRVSQELARQQCDVLAATYPDAHCELNFDSAFTLLVATVLSAQTTDERVNQVTPSLFAKWPGPDSMAGASIKELEETVKPLGIYRRRADSLKRLSAKLLADYGGIVPGNRKELTTLPGVGRKTANVVLGNWFGKQEITVDTHVGRVTRRLGWTIEKDPVKVEKDLWNFLPEAPWTQLCHELIFHGRRVCFSRAPNCVDCPLLELCPSAKEFI